MLELLVCALFTVFPDYLYRRYAQDKRVGREITIFSVWFELRYGIVACLFLTLALITTIFYFHPSTSNALSMFRTVTILPERGGRVEEVLVVSGDDVEAGQPLFRLDAAAERAALDTATRRIAETDAAIRVAEADLVAVEARAREAESALTQARDELDRTLELQARNASVVAQREIDRLTNVVAGREAALEAARASRETLRTQIDALLPAQRASAEAQAAEARVALDKSVIVAGVAGRLEQFVLRPGDFVSPVMRPAGLLIPREGGRKMVQAGFGQIEAQVLRPGMIAEITCAAKPLTVIPMVVTEVQSVIASGQFRPTDQLVDVSAVRGGTLTVFLEPLFEGGLDGLPPGSACVANAYTSNHDRLDDPELSALGRFGLHAIDAVGVVHALLLRINAILLPVRTLVLSGGH